MKVKKRDGKGSDMPTDHTKIKPERPQETLKKLIRKYIAITTKEFEEQVDK